MTVYLFLRRTEDWSNIKNPGELRNFHPSYNHLDKIKWWNQAFALDWYQFRFRLRSIARSAWRHPILTDIRELDFLEDDDLIIPVDDDDWFHPDISDYVLDLIGSYDFLYWRHLICTTSFHCDILPTPHPWPGTNGYVVRLSGLKKMPQYAWGWILNNHVKSANIAREFGLTVYRDNAVMSIYNLHPGSISSWRSCSSFQDFIKIIPKNVLDIPDRWSWINPQFERMMKLIREVRWSSHLMMV